MGTERETEVSLKKTWRGDSIKCLEKVNKCDSGDIQKGGVEGGSGGEREPSETSPEQRDYLTSKAFRTGDGKFHYELSAKDPGAGQDHKLI